MANAPTPTTVATPANAGGSNKSTPAPKVGIPADVKKWLRRVMIAIAVIIGIVLIASVARSPEQKQPEKAMLSMKATAIPLASSPQSSWPKLVIQADGQSYVPRPSGMHIVTAGLNYTSYAVYGDGHECSFKTSCPEGSLGANIRNESTKVNVVSYAYASD